MPKTIYNYVVKKNNLRPNFIGFILDIVSGIGQFLFIDSNLIMDKPWVIKAPIHYDNSMLLNYEPRDVRSISYGVSFRNRKKYPNNISGEIVKHLFPLKRKMNLLWKFIFSGAKKEYQMELYEYAAYEYFSSCLSEYQFKEIYFYNYYGPEIQGLIKAAKEKGINTIELQHGSILGIHGCYNGDNIENVSLPDIIFCWNEFSSELIKNKLGVETEVHNHSQQVEKGDKVLITLGSDTTGVPRLISNLLHLNCLIKVKPHPRHKFNDEIPNDKRIEILAQNSDIYEALNGCCLHITKASGSFFQAFESNIPTLLITEKSIDWYEYYKESGLVYYSKDVWSKDINKIIENSKYSNR